MSRKLWTWLVLFTLLWSAISMAVTAAQPAPTPAQSQGLFQANPNGIQNVGTSTLANVTPAILPVGTAFDLCFTVLVQSPDQEYLDHFHVDLPDNWTVNSVAPDSVPPANAGGCPGALPPESGVDTGNVVFWQSGDYPPQTGCGAWLSTADGNNFDFCANVTIPDANGAPWTLPWSYIGDGYAAAPHEASGNYGPIAAPIVLTPEQTEAWGCACEMQGHELTVWNNAGYDTVVNLSYTVVSGAGDCDGPSSFLVPNGTSHTFTVAVLPGGDPGDTVTCQATAQDATNPANSDTSLIVKHLRSTAFDPAGWQLGPIANATEHFLASGVVGTHPAAAGPVGYVVGGLDTAFLNPDLQMYDPATGAWTQLADLPNPRLGTVVGWIDGRLYAAGGYDPNTNVTDDLQVYDPATDTWDNTNPANLPFSRGGGAGGVGTCAWGSESCLFYVGGSELNFANPSLATWQYHPGTDTWTQLDDRPAGSSPAGFYLGAGAGCLDQVYVGGDWRGYHDFYRLDATQPAGSQWTELADIPAAAGAKSPTLVCKEDWNALVLIGGDPTGGWSGSNTAYVYDIATDTWIGPLPQTLNVPQLGSVGWHLDGKVWTVGGTIGGGAITPMPFESLAQIPCNPDACGQWLNAYKSAPATALNAEVISYTITLEPHLAAPTVMTDLLPAGVAYAGNLDWTAGNAWYSPTVNTVFWETAWPGKVTGGSFVEPVLLVPPELQDAMSTAGSDLTPAPKSTILAAGDPIITWTSGITAAWGIAFDGRDTSVWAGDGWGNTDSMYEYTPAGTPTGRVHPFSWPNLGLFGPADLAYNWNTGLLWVMNVNTGVDNCIHEIDPAMGYTGNDICPGGGTGFADSQRGLAYDPVNDLFFAGGWNEGIIYRFDPGGTMVDSAYVGLAISGLAYNPETRHLFVQTNGGTNDVYVLDASSPPSYPQIGQFHIGSLAAGAGLEIDCEGQLWAIDQADDMVYRAESGETANLCSVEITFDVEVTGHCGDLIVNQATAGLAGIEHEFAALTVVGGDDALLTVAPVALETSLCRDTAGVETLSICNEGDCPLSWLVYEQMPPGTLAGSMPFVPVDVAAREGGAEPGTLSSPTAGHLALPVAPAGPDAVLWDQPLSTVDQDALLCLALTDYPDRTAFIADDFVNAEPWLVNGLFIPGRGWIGFASLWNASALTWQIYANDGGVPAGDPSGGGDPPVWTLTLPPADPHVTISDGSHNPAANIMLNPPVALVLPPGHWWLVFYPTVAYETFGYWGRQPADTTNGYTGKFINPGGFWGHGPDWVDWTFTGFPPDTAFRLEGEVLPAPEEIPWLSLSASSGTVPGGQCQEVDVTFDAAGLPVGSYEGNLLLLSNDLGTPQVNVPALLSVEQCDRYVYLPLVTRNR